MLQATNIYNIVNILNKIFSFYYITMYIYYYINSCNLLKPRLFLNTNCKEGNFELRRIQLYFEEFVTFNCGKGYFELRRR